MRVLFFVEGFTDIRFVTGLSEICELTMAVPRRQYRDSGLADRVAASGARVRVIEIPGGRLAFQARSLPLLLSSIRRFDVALSQEVLRGSLNATLAGALRGVPVVTYMGIAPVEYFRCRRERGQIGPLTAFAGESVIRALMWINGHLASRTLAMGPYLRDVAARYSKRAHVGLYYGVDTERFRPAPAAERAELRRAIDLPEHRFVVFLSSRISHEKDPETVIRAVALARARGLDAVLVNLSGGWRDFLALAHGLGVPEGADWLLARPAVSPLTEVQAYFRSADAAALASLAEGAAYSTLEALACGTPVVATNIGGMAVQLAGYAQLVPRRDPEAMAAAFLAIARDPDAARAQALSGRAYVERAWSRRLAFEDLGKQLEEVIARHRGARPPSP